MRLKVHGLVRVPLFLASIGAAVANLCTVPSAAAQCVSKASPYGINIHAPQGLTQIPLLDEVQAGGLGWVRIDLVWAWVEPGQDSFNWSIYDTLVAQARARGLYIFATISHTPGWATSGSAGPGVPNNPADFYDVCFRAAQRYGNSIEHWGMWNEPNLPQFWAGSRPQYIDLILKNGADAVHAANPNAKVCGPELAHLSSANWDAWLTDCINQAGSQLDVLTHHVYGSNHNVVTDRLEKAAVFPWDSASVKQILQNTGWWGRPFWLTEVGWESDKVGEATQASYYTGLLNNWFTGQTGRSWIDKIFFYELNDTQAFSEYSFGILGPEPTYARKPTFTAYQNFIAAYPAPAAIPNKAGSPFPMDLATHVDLNADLSWSAEPCASTYDVYLGTTSPGAFRGSQATTSYDPGRLARRTTYYWRIDTLNGGTKTTGDVWQLTTGGVQADFDDDDDVDQDDFGHLQTCLSGNGEPYVPGCGTADLDGDGDVDGADVAAFQNCMAGGNRPPGC